MSASAILKDCAQRLATRPGDPEAVAVLEGLLDTPDRLEAARFLVPVYERAKNHERLIRALEAVAAASAEPGERVAAFERVAAVYRRELKQPDLALAAAAKALAVAPGDAALHRLAEEVAVEAGAVDVLVELLTDALEQTPVAAQGPLHRALAGLYERHQHDPETTIRHLRSALAASPGDPVMLESLRRQHEQRSEWAALAEVTETIARVDPDRARQSAAWRSAASLHESKLYDDESSLECWLHVLELAPGDAEAIDAVRGLATALEVPARLAQALDRAREATTGERRHLLTFQLAELQAYKLSAPETAVVLCRQLLDAQPAHAGARALLDALVPPVNPTQALLAALGEFKHSTDRVAMLPELHRLAKSADALDELAEAVESESEHVENSEQLAALLRFVALLREELGQPKLATVLWNDLLAAQPNDVEALAHLATLLADAGDHRHAAEASLRRARLSHLGPERHARFAEAATFWLAEGDTRAALDALEESLSRQRPVEDAGALGRVQLLRGQLLERASDERAVEAYEQALPSPEHRAAAAEGLERLMALPATRSRAARALEPVVRSLDQPHRLAAVLEVLLDSPEGPSVRQPRLRELAALWDRAGQPRSALAALLRAYALAPADARLRAEVERLAESLGAKDELLAAYEEALERDPTVADASLLRRVAELNDGLGNRDAAFAAWERAVQAAPEDQELLKAWAKKCRARGDLARLAKATRAQISATSDSAEKTRLLYELANLCEDGLADHVGAAHAYRELLDCAPNDRALLKMLARLYEQTQNAAGLAEVMGRDLALARAAGSDEVPALGLRLAQLKLAAASDDAGALDLLREVLTLSPGNAQAVAALARLASTQGPVQSQAAQLATPALDRLGDYPVVVQILEAQLATQTGPRERAAMLRQISDLQAGPLKDPDLAFLAITRALREAPQDQTLLQRCLELAEAAGATDDLEALLGELAASQPAGVARAGLFRALARRLDGHTHHDEAIAAWSEVLAQSPADAEAAGRLQALFEAAGRFTELAVLARQRADSAPLTERPAALLALAHACERADQLDEAASTLLNLFALTQGIDALAALERVLGRLRRHLEQAEALKRLAAASNDLAERLNHLLHQARALLAASEPELAVEVFAEVLQRSPSEQRAVAALGALVVEPKVRERAIELLSQVFRAPEQARQRVAVLELLMSSPGLEADRGLRTELATLLESLGDFTHAFAGRLRLVLEQPLDAAARADLERLANTAGLHEELVASYEDLLERSPAPEVALGLRLAVARIYSGPLHRPGLAVRFWDEVLASAPDSLEALGALAALHRASNDHPALARVLMRQAALLPKVAEQVACLRELADVAEHRLHKRELVVDAYQQLLQRAPDDVPALQALGKSLESLGQHARAAEVLEQQLAVAEGAQRADEVTDLKLQLGQLALGPLARYEHALERFTQVLELRWPEPAAVTGLETLLVRAPALRPAIARVLERVYRHRQEPSRLAEALELQLPVAEGPRALALLDELATLRESLGELPLAFLAWQELFARTPTDARVRRELERLAEVTAQLDELAELFRERLTHGPDHGEAVELWRRVAQLYLRLGDRARAAEAFEELTRLLPDAPAPLVELCQLYAAEQAWAKLPRLLTRRVELDPSRARQTELLLELAELSETRLNDLGAAIEACRAALARSSADARAVPMLERLLERSGRFPELAEQLKGRIAAARATGDEPLELELAVVLARVQHRSLDDDVAALELLTSVLGRAEGHPAAVEVLEEVMRSGLPAADRAAAALERHYQQTGAPGPLVEALEVRVRWASGPALAALLHRLAEVHERQLSSLSNAFEALARLLRAQPEDSAALERLLGLSTPAGKDAALAQLLTEVSARVSRAPTRLAMLRPLARLREQLGESELALQAWRELLVTSPDDDEALRASAALLEAGARWAELVEVLERRLKLCSDDQARGELLKRIGEVRDDSLADAEGAYGTFRALIELRPDDAPTLVRLDRLCEQLQRWPEQAEVLGRRLRLEPADRNELALRLAHVRRARIGNGAGALPLLGEILHAEPAHAGALAELTALLDDQPGWEPAEDLALGAHRRARDFGRLAVLLDACATRALTVARRRALWLELAELRLEQQDDPALAFLALARAWRESPHDAALRDRLVALAGPAEAHEGLAAIIDEVLPQLEPAAAAEASLVQASLCEGPLREPERAVTLYRRALELAPPLAPKAWAGLDRTLQSLGRWDELLPVLEARERAAEEGPERVGLLARIATVAGEHLGRVERAAEAWRAVLQRESTHLIAARALEALYERSGDQARLVEILGQLLGLVPAGQRQAVRLKLATRCLASDPERTISLCRQMLLDDPLHVEAFDLLAQRLEQTDRHAELDKLLQARLAVTLAPEPAAELEFRLGELAWRKLGALEPAAARFRAVLERSPRHLGALLALSELYESLAQLRPLSQVLAELAAVQQAAALRLRHHLRRAEVLGQLGETEGAVAAARQALDLAPEDEADIERLRVLLLGLQALPEAARALVLAADLRLQKGRVEEAIATWFELSAVHARALNVVSAAGALEKVLVQQPANRAAYDQARALYAGASLWGPWAALVAKYVPQLAGDEKLATLDELTRVHQQHLKDAAGAFGWARQAVQGDPGSAPRRQRCEVLALGLRRVDELAADYRALLQALPFGRPWAALALRLAAFEDEPLHQVDRAEQTLHSLLAHEPGNADALEQLVQLFTRRRLSAKLVGALELSFEASADREARVQLLRQLAEVHERQLQDAAAAAHALRRLLALAPEVAHARQLVELHRRHQQWPEALSTLLQLRLLVTTPAERADTQLQIAELHEVQLEDEEAAVDAYLQALEYDPGSSVAFRALEGLYLQLQRPAELLRAYEQRLSRTEDLAERVELQFKCADLWEARASLLNADRCLEAVLAVEPKNLRALEGLARVRRAEGRWRPLVEALTRWVDAAEPAPLRAVLCTELGELHLARLKDPDGAARWWSRALELVPDHRPALHQQGALHQQVGRWPEAVTLLQREAGLEPDLAARCELQFQAGVILEEKLHESARAREAWRQALVSEPVHLPSLRRLRAQFFKAGEWPEYEQNLAHEARRAPTADDRCAAALELARHFEARTHDAAQAIGWFTHAFTQRPDSLDAALPLATLLLAAGSWARAADVVQAAVSLLEKAGPGQRRELSARLSQLAQARRMLNQPQQALDAYARALLLDSADAVAMRGQVDLLDTLGKSAEAVESLEGFLRRQSDSLAMPERAALRSRLALLHWKLGQADKALSAAESAIDVDPVHGEALRLLVTVCDARQLYEKAVLYRQRLAAVVKEDERYRLLVELSVLAQEKLNSPARAIDGYLKALEVRPGSLEVLQRLHGAYRDAGHNRKATETLQALLAHPQLAPAEWRQGTLALADLLEKSAPDWQRAVELLEAALDKDVTFLEALQKLEAVLGKARQWAQLDGCYRRMIGRLAGSEQTASQRSAMWRAIGELRLHRVKDRGSALEALEAGARLSPDDVQAQEAFADLALEFRGREADAVSAYVRVLSSSPDPKKVCTAAGLAAERAGDPDTRFLAARASQTLFEAAEVAASEPPRFRAPLADAPWRQHLLHPSVLPVGELMALIFEHGGAKYAGSLGDFKLHPKKHAVDLATASHPAMQRLALVARALGFEGLTVWSPWLTPQTSARREPHPDDRSGLKVVPTFPLSFVVGEKFLTEAGPGVLHAVIGRSLAFLRPELALAAMLPPERLALVYEAALSLGDPAYVSAADPKLLKAERKQLEKALPASARVALLSVVARLRKSPKADELARYLEGARLTSLRTALLVTGDFAPVRSRLIPDGPGADATRRELLKFALGGSLHALRVETGTAVAR